MAKDVRASGVYVLRLQCWGIISESMVVATID